IILARGASFQGLLRGAILKIEVSRLDQPCFIKCHIQQAIKAIIVAYDSITNQSEILRFTISKEVRQLFRFESHRPCTLLNQSGATWADKMTGCKPVCPI